MKKRCAIFANCQRQLIETFLQSSDEFVEEYCFERIPYTYEAVYQNLEVSEEVLARTDLFIYQPLGEKYGELSTDRLVTKLRPNCITISFPYLYFKGYYPQDIDNPLAKPEAGYPFGRFPYGDRNIINFVEAGKSRAEIIERLTQPDFYDQAFLLNLVEETLQELTRREKETDIKIATLIRQRYQHELLFYTVNHPSNTIGREVVNQMLQILKLPLLKKPPEFRLFSLEGLTAMSFAVRVANRMRRMIDLKPVPNPYREVFGDNQIPLYPSVIQQLNLTGVPINHRYRQGQQKLTFAEYVAAYLTQYD